MTAHNPSRIAAIMDESPDNPEARVPVVAAELFEWAWLAAEPADWLDHATVTGSDCVVQLFELLSADLFNDVTAIVLYHVAISGVVTGSFSAPVIAGEFALSAVIAVAVGLIVGWLSARLAPVLGASDPIPVIIMSLVLPSAVYVLADHLYGSGVLAVLVYSLYLTGKGRDPDDVVGRLTFNTFWGIIEVAVTGITFGVIGLEVTAVLDQLDSSWPSMIGSAAVVAGTVVLVRLLWLLPASWFNQRPGGGRACAG